MNITSAGIGSGLDLEGIIEAYINAESIPTEIRLQEKEDRLKTEISGIGQFKSALSTFDAILKKLSDSDDFNKQTVEASTEDIEVTTNGFASNGSFEIDIQQLAQGSRLQSVAIASSDTILGAGTLTFGAGADSFDVVISPTDTLSGIRDKINEQSENFGVTANIINTDSGTYIVYDSEITGDGNDLSVTASGTVALGRIADRSTQGVDDYAQSARALVDGNVVTQDTNEFKNVIEDVTFVANKVSTAPTTLSIAQDAENGKTLLSDFVTGYNALIFTMENLANPENGELAFDSNIRQMKAQLNMILSDTVTGLTGSIDTLDDIGITLTRESTIEVSAFGIGTMASGVEKRDAALLDKLNEIGELFASDNGVATRMGDLIASYNDSDGTLTKRQSVLNVNLSGIADEYENLETKLRNYEETLRRKFTFLDQTVAQYTATSDWLTTALAVNTNSKD